MFAAADPGMFHIDWERTLEVLGAVVLMAFIIERALSVLFENHYFVKHLQGGHFKELIALVVSFAVCKYWEFDMVSMIFLKEQVTTFGMVITAGVVAGGSKGAMKLFKDVMHLSSDAEQIRRAPIKALLKKQGEA